MAHRNGMGRDSTLAAEEGVRGARDRMACKGRDHTQRRSRESRYSCTDRRLTPAHPAPSSRSRRDVRAVVRCLYAAPEPGPLPVPLPDLHQESRKLQRLRDLTVPHEQVLFVGIHESRPLPPRGAQSEVNDDVFDLGEQSAGGRALERPAEGHWHFGRPLPVADGDRRRREAKAFRVGQKHLASKE